MAQRNIRVYFYGLTVMNDLGGVPALDYLWSLFTNPAHFENGVSVLQATNSRTGKACELRNVEVVGNVVKGCLALLRDDAPNLRKSDGQEGRIELGDGETLLEKNYFLYFRDSGIVVWQFNLAANHVSNLSLILSVLGGMQRVVSYSHVIKNAFAMEPGAVIEYVDLKVSQPKRKPHRAEVEALDPTDWGFDPFKIMSDSGANQISIKLTNRSETGLFAGLKQLVDDLTDVSVTRKLKVKIEGADEPIDMLTERYTYKESVEFDGHYPDPDRVFEALNAAKDKFNAEQAAQNT